ncbi:MAG: hypothetical protein QOC65_1411 [Sphingomonadales bacterium]|nr:hypothetical protein [Sphingomonadales bacterium]
MARVEKLSELARWPLRSDARSLIFALAVTLGVELVLAERRFQIFSGSISRPRKLDTVAEWSLFIPTLASAQAALLVLIFLSIRLCHRRRSSERLRCDFIFWSLLVLIAAAWSRYRILLFLSDEAGVQLIRALGGGSLLNAFAYVLDEAAPILAAIAAIVVAYLFLRRLASAQGDPGSGPPVPQPWRRRRGCGVAAALGLSLALLWIPASRAGDTRLVLERFVAPYSLFFLLDAATDFDRDGYGFFAAHADGAPFDAAVHPFALDVPGNGVDEDGYGGDAPVPPPAPADLAPVFGETRRHVVLIVLESVRADALTMRWGAMRVAPNLARIAAEGSHSTAAYSHSGYTASSLKALFSGRIEPAGNAPSLFRDFRRAGYRVGTFSAQVANFGGVGQAAGIRANSNVFVDPTVLEGERIFGSLRESAWVVDGQALIREFERTFGQAGSWSRPNFIYFNFQASHYPYNNRGALHFLPIRPVSRSEIDPSNAERVRATYWDSVAYSDWLVGRIVDRLRALGVFEDSIVIIVSDHGEQLFENGFIGHGQLLNRIQTQVPLVINRPNLAIPRPFGHADLRGLILRLAGAQLPEAPARDVFQYVGMLDTPSSIALVQADGGRTILDLETGEVSGPAAPRPVPYRELDPSSALGRRAERLVRSWEAERWARHNALRTSR